MRFFLLFLLFLLLTIPGAFGQHPMVMKVEQVFSFEPYPDGYSRVSNELLQRIAQGSGRLRVYTKFALAANLSSHIEKDLRGGTSGMLMIRDIQFTGDVMYRDFSLEKILMPTHIDMTLSLLDARGNVLYDTLVKGARIPANGGPVLGFVIPARLQSAAVSVKPSGVNFYYTEEAFGRFQGWFNALEHYYAAGSQLEGTREIISKLDYSRAETLLLDEFALCEAEGLFNSIKHAPFHHWIDLDRSDPEHLINKLNVLDQSLASLRSGFNKAIATIDSMYYSLGVQLIGEGSDDKAREYLLRGVTYNPFHIPSHLAIATLDLKRGNPAAALDRMGNVIQKMYPDDVLKQKTMLVTQDILEVLFAQSRDLTWAHRYLDALKVLVPVEKFCLQVSGFMECPPELSYRMTASHMGMYRSFLTVAARARRGDNLAFATTYIGSALEYQQKNPDFIPDDGEAMEQMQRVLDRFVERGYLKLSLMEYRQAAIEFQQAMDLCTKYPGMQCPQRVEELFAEASSLEKQVVIIGREPVKPSPQVVSIGENDLLAIRQVLLEKLSEGHLKAWAGELQEARTILLQVTEMSLQYQLRSDTLINSRVLSLSQRILDKQCELFQRAFSGLLEETLEFHSESQIFRAAQAAQEALELLDSNPRCQATDADDLQRLQDLAAVAPYQVLLHDALQTYRDQAGENYEVMFESYRNAESLFITNNLQRFGLTHTAFPVFIEQSANPAMVNAAIVYLAQWPEEHLPDIVRMLEGMRSRGVRMAEMRTAQEAAGQMMAAFSGNTADNSGQQQMNLLKEKGGRWYQYLEVSFKEYKRNNP